MIKLLFIWLSIILLLTSCIQDLDDWLKTNDISFKRKVDTKYFSQDYASIEIKKINNDLTILLQWDCPSKFPFPIDGTTNDTLSMSQFIFCFKENEKVIPLSNFIHYKNTSSDFEMDSSQFIIKTNSHNFKKNCNELLNIPMYYFNSLKAGKHEITVDIYQDRFSVVPSYNETDSSRKNVHDKFITLIKGSITFKLNIPQIYKTAIFANGFVLKNDSTWSPAGMDFSLFTSGYPDIYWELFYPVTSSSDLSHPYYISSIERTNVERLIADTIILFHYKPNDRVIIGVYDHDDISRDDFIGDWYGSIKLLSNKDETYLKLTFDYVKWIAIKSSDKGIINK